MADATTTHAQTFMKTLQQAEQSGDVAPLTALFAVDGECGSIATKQPAKGSAAIAEFWKGYLSAFRSIHSTFVHQTAGGGLAALEWTSEGTLPTGAAINYQGVSLLEFDGSGKVKRFRTYYDSAAFLPEGAKTLGREVKV